MQCTYQYRTVLSQNNFFVRKIDGHNYVTKNWFDYTATLEQQ